MPNQTLIALPTEFENLDQVRMFLVRLVEQVDIILGLRGDARYLSVNNAESLVNAEAQDTLSSLSKAVKSLETKVNKAIPGPTVNSRDDNTITISGTYQQAEVEAVRDEVYEVNSKLSALISALKTSGVLS